MAAAPVWAGQKKGLGRAVRIQGEGMVLTNTSQGRYRNSGLERLHDICNVSAPTDPGASEMVGSSSLSPVETRSTGAPRVF